MIFLIQKFRGNCKHNTASLDSRTGKKLRSKRLTHSSPYSSDYVDDDGVRFVECEQLEPFYPTIQRKLLSDDTLMEILHNKYYINKFDCIIRESMIHREYEKNRQFNSLKELANEIGI